MSAAFTPEHWQHDGLTIVARGRGVIAKIPTPQAGGVTECSTNARLIAAAPELYETLEHVRELLVAYGPRYIAKATKLADAALAKARGDQS